MHEGKRALQPSCIGFVNFLETALDISSAVNFYPYPCAPVRRDVESRDVNPCTEIVTELDDADFIILQGVRKQKTGRVHIFNSLDHLIPCMEGVWERIVLHLD